MKYIRIFFLIQTLAWTYGAAAALLDPNIGSPTAKVAVLITASACWGALATMKHIWKEEK